MRDGPLRRAVKAVARWNTLANLAAHRALRRLRGERPYRLGGACQGCARCCEAPSIQVGRLTWYMPTLRRLFLGWQRVVNGFELVTRERPRVFVFRCTHFDPETRRCDSYDARPAMCRDYPRLLLWQATPELFEGCGFRAVHPDAARLRAALEARGLPEDKLAAARRRMFLDE
ncbi:MAG: YkgJ family cysteine cluster protein [Alphaproteobacteria bacterium]|nr:YkgJ family cysteine cluster protein [Alphaproteobacteria bacterium]